jgi:hypothetical protein
MPVRVCIPSINNLTVDTLCRIISAVPKDPSFSSPPTETGSSAISRRQFGRFATAAAALAVSSPGALPSISPTDPSSSADKSAGDEEIEIKLANIIRKYGSRLSEPQREHLRHILTYNQKMLASIRAFPVENGDAPAVVLKFPSGEENKR